MLSAQYSFRPTLLQNMITDIVTTISSDFSTVQLKTDKKMYAISRNSIPCFVIPHTINSSVYILWEYILPASWRIEENAVDIESPAYRQFVWYSGLDSEAHINMVFSRYTLNISILCLCNRGIFSPYTGTLSSVTYYCPGEIRNQGTYGSYGGICSYGIGNYFYNKIYNVKLWSVQ